MIKELPKEIQEALNQRFLSICKRSSKMFPGLENEEIFNSFQPERLNPEDSYLHAEFGCSTPIKFNTSQGIKRMEPGKIYDQNLNEI